jgi:hypothetical protein
VSSGLIYAAIVVLWAVVLVPMWLRRHDEATETRSIDRFQGAMHILSRRPGSAGRAADSSGQAAGDTRDIVVPARDRTKTVPDGATAAFASPAAMAARRRMGVVAILLGITAIVLLASAMHRAPVWAAAVPFAVLVGYLLQVRHSIQSARARDHAERRARAAELRAERMVGAVERQARGEVGVPLYASEVASDLFDAETAVRAAQASREPVVPAAVAAEAPGAEAVYDAVADDAWEPVPVPVPTYVSAPRAPREVRVIDLTRPGAWTSGRLETDADPGPAVRAGEAETPRDPIVTGELLIERRQAVGD